MKISPHGGDIYRNPNVIDFSANINPCGPPEGLLCAVRDNILQIKNYPDVYCSLLRKKIAQKESVGSEKIICGNGAAELIFSLVLAVRPKRALLMSPTFAEYEQALKTVDCEIVYFDTKREEHFAVTENVLEKITDDLDMVFLCNPNNPTGVMTDQPLLNRILEKCQKTETLFVIDECFLDFTGQSDACTMKDYLGEYKNIFLLKAFTKLYAMPGLRLGYGLCSNLGLLEKMFEVTQPWNVSVPAQLAGVAALKEEEYVASSLRFIKKERKRLVEALVSCGCTVIPPSANYIFFHGDERIGEFVLNQGICIRDCSNYRGLLSGDYRIAVRLEKENEQLIKVIEKGKGMEWQNQS